MDEQKSDEKRPPIPADIKRRVLVEAGHRCAIPTCRYIETELHHIVPWSQCKAHEYDNLIALCANCHRRADRGEIDRKALLLYKFNLRFAHDKFSQLEMDVLFEMKDLPQNQGIYWPPFMILLLKRLVDSGYLLVQQPDGQILMHGMPSAPLIIALSPKGRSFLADLGHVEF